MSTLDVNDKAPAFTLPANAGLTVSLGDYSGRYLVLYFYPRDDTPGCTTEAKDFTTQKSAFGKLGADIVGVSKDTVAKHDKFIAKHDLGITLLSDEAGDMVENYGVWLEKMNYGRKYMGIERSTFLIDPSGNIVNVWRKVRVKSHVDKVLAALKDIVEA